MNQQNLKKTTMDAILDRPPQEKRHLENSEQLKQEIYHLTKKRDELYAQLRYSVSRLEALNSLADKLQYVLQELPLQEITMTGRSRLDQYEAELFGALMDHGFSVLYSTDSVEKSIAAVQNKVDSERDFLTSYLENLERLAPSNQYYADMIPDLKMQIDRLNIITEIVIEKLKEFDQ